MEIIELHAAGYTCREIANCIAVSQSNFAQIIQKEKTTKSLENHARPGRPRKMSPWELQRLNQTVEENLCAALPEITAEYGLNCHSRMIKKLLH